MAGNLQFKSAIVACVLSLIIFAQPGVSADEKAPAGVLKWKAGIGNPDQGGSQAELSAAGNERFRYGTGDEIWWPMVPAIGGDGTIYVGSNDNNLYAINPDGTEKWSYPTGSDVNSPPAVGSDGTIYFGSHDNKVYALNPDGTLKWSYQTGDAVSSSPALGGDGTIYVCSWDNHLYALMPDGTLKWKYKTWDAVISSPAVAVDGIIYVGSLDAFVYAIYPDGSLKWRYQTEGGVNSSPAVGFDGTIYVGSLDGHLYALNPDGTLEWRFQTGDLVISSPAVGIDETIYVGSCDDYLYAINPDGILEWAFHTEADIWSSPTVGSDGTIYFGLYAYQFSINYVQALMPSGTSKWKVHMGNQILSSIAIGSDGTLYVGSTDGQLYALETGTSLGLALSPWPKFQQDAENSGESVKMAQIPEELVSLTYIPVSGQAEEVLFEEYVILSGDGTGRLTEPPKYLAPWITNFMAVAVQSQDITQDHTFNMTCYKMGTAGWGCGNHPEGNRFLKLAESDADPLGVTLLTPGSDLQPKALKGPMSPEGDCYAFMVTFEGLSKANRRGYEYYDIDVGGYAGAIVEPALGGCGYRGVGAAPGHRGWIRSGSFEVTWLDAGDGSLTVDIMDKTHGITIPFSQFPDEQEHGWGFWTKEGYGDEFPVPGATHWNNGTYYMDMNNGIPFEERAVQMLDRIPADNTENIALWVNGLPWVVHGEAGITMPAAGTVFTIANCFGEWNEDFTEFTQYADAPYPGDRWQIDVQGMTIEEPEPPPGDVTLACDSVSAEPGFTGELSISLDNESAAVAGGQFVIVANPADRVTFCGVSSSSRTDGWIVSTNAAGGGQMVLFYSESGGTLSTGTGEILTLCYQVSSDIQTSCDIALTFSGVQIADENKQPLSTALENGCIAVTGTAPEKTCDFSGDGKILINDVIVFLLRARDNPNDPAVDWNGDGKYAINDAIILLLDIMNGTCPDVSVLLSATANSDPLAGIETLSPGDISYIEQMMEQMRLAPEQEEALRIALYGASGPASLPKAFSLCQNSPNPFNPATTIGFSVPEGASEYVSLKIFDLRGRLVRTLVNEIRDAGNYSVFWDGTDEAGRPVSSGVYFCRMRAGEFMQTRKMVLLK